jgi:alkanesulfonate monooxygenase SsuD/methylene tetrahydromethanopterin reductase-like flavin-dependent oxidoreductase (luciferase family)
VAAGNIADIRAMAVEDFGQMRDDVKFLAMICPIIIDTEGAAKAKHDDCLQYIDM